MPHPRFDAFLETIRQKRKQTPFLTYLRDIASWQPINFYVHPRTMSRYPFSDRIRAVDAEIWDAERSELHKYGQSIDEHISVLEQFESLFRTVPQRALYNDPRLSENVTYSDQAGASKNVYLSFVVAHAENVAHSLFIKGSTDVFDSVAVWDHSENVYSSTGIIRSHAIFYSRFIQDSRDIWFSVNLIGCQECLFCSGLVNQQFAIHNQVYEREIYFLKKAEILSQKDRFEPWYRETRVRGMIVESPGSSGNFVIGSEGVESGLCCYNVHEGRNVLFTGGASPKERFYDSFASGSLQDIYGSLHGVHFAEHIYCTAYACKSYMMLYCHQMDDCSHCFGCVGLQWKTFHIFNRPYAEADWYSEVEKLLERMESEGTLGEFFLPTTNPFYFDETIAGLMYDFDRKEMESFGYRYAPEKAPAPAAVAGDDILTSEGGESFRLTSLEKAFIQKHQLPLPRRHWRERMRENLIFQ